MKRIILTSAIVFIGFIGLAKAQTTDFTYQGKLNNGGIAANGFYDLKFDLYDSLTAGTLIKSITVSGVQVNNGIFTVNLNFIAPPGGTTLFADGSPKYLEIWATNTGTFTTPLMPRQQVKSTPYAIRSIYSENAVNLGGLPANTYLQTNGNGAGLTNLNGANITPGTVNSSALAPDVFSNNRNLSLLGSLRWDLLEQRVPVGASPTGTAFDGVHIWVANYGDGNITKVRVSDSVTVGTFTVGTNPYGVAFDGANIWVTNFGSNNVTKLRANDGVLLGTFAVGVNPYGVAFDGLNIWVTNTASNNVTKLRASDGVVQGTFAANINPSGIAFDGAYVWIRGNSLVSKLRASDGTNLGTFTVVDAGLNAVAFDGANIWISNNTSVTKRRASDGTFLGTFSVGSTPRGIAFDGKNIWVGNAFSNTVTKLRANDGSLQDTFQVGASPYGVVFDGVNMWVANSGDNNLIKLPVFP
jgi:hypothetical protein